MKTENFLLKTSDGKHNLMEKMGEIWKKQNKKL